MRCERCLHDNPALAQFCGRCGARMEWRCPACDRTNPPGNRFCHGCGTPVPTASGPGIPGEATTPSRVAQEILASGTGPRGEPAPRPQRMLLVVSRDQMSLYNQLVREFSDKENIRVIMDRRVGERRTGDLTPRPDRRGQERRVRAHTDSQLRSLGWSVIRFDSD